MQMTLTEALETLDRVADGNYWHISKGKTQPTEPMFAAAVYAARYDDNDKPLAIAEGDKLEDVIHEVALKMGDPEALRKEHC